jgi:hypothetical protein
MDRYHNYPERIAILVIAAQLLSRERSGKEIAVPHNMAGLGS